MPVASSAAPPFSIDIVTRLTRAAHLEDPVVLTALVLLQHQDIRLL